MGFFFAKLKKKVIVFFFSSRRRHTRCSRDWSSDVCSSDLLSGLQERRHFVAVQDPGYDRLSRRFWNQMMTIGTVKSFNPSKGYGFIKTEGGADVFVHLSAVRTAGFRDLRKGQKVSFEIFDNQGKAAARNLHINGSAEDDSGHNLSLAEMGPEITRCNMSQKKTEQSAKKRTWIARAALE